MYADLTRIKKCKNLGIKSLRGNKVNISIKRSDELKNSGDAAKLNFVKSKLKVAEKTILDTIGTGLYSNGTDAKSIVGLRVMTNTSATVGGISQSSYSW